MDIDLLLIPPAASLHEAIATLDRAAGQIVLVVDTNKRLIGTVTDGDIRRALLQGETLDSPVERVMRRAFRALPASASQSEALALMRHEVLQQVPAVDSHGRVVHLFLLEDLLKPRTLQNSVVLMAGGEGKRLLPLTKDCPKPMLLVGGKPLLEILLEQCINAGFRHFYLSVNYLKHQIKNYFGDGARWNVAVEYLEEDRPLGTAGALSLLPSQPDHPLLVMNADVLTRVDFNGLLRFHAEHQSAATLCVNEHTTQIPYGVVRTDDIRVVMLEEKPVLNHYVNAGIYLLNPDVLDLLPADHFFDMPQLLQLALQRDYRVNAFPIHEYWLDVGRPDTFDRANGEWQ